VVATVLKKPTIDKVILNLKKANVDIDLSIPKNVNEKKKLCYLDSHGLFVTTNRRDLENRKTHSCS
jgi:hypothetical protein